MTEPQYAALVFLPVVLAVVATAVAWRKISRPWLFLVAGLLALLGLQSVAAPAAVGFFLPSPTATAAAVDTGFGRALVVSAVLQVIVGFPFLWWLSRGLRKS